MWVLDCPLDRPFGLVQFEFGLAAWLTGAGRKTRRDAGTFCAEFGAGADGAGCLVTLECGDWYVPEAPAGK